MSFTALILKSLFRQRTRSVLAILGIAIAVTTVVALGVVAGVESNPFFLLSGYDPRSLGAGDLQVVGESVVVAVLSVAAVR